MTVSSNSIGIGIGGVNNSETPRQNQSVKMIPFSNGRQKHDNVVVGGGVRYTECLKNHAARLGSHALDGCGEFMPAPTAIPTDPTSLKCAACGCHRNFHRQEQNHDVQRIIEYHPQHRHHPLPPSGVHAVAACQVRSPGSSTYHPVSAPHTLLALSSGGDIPSRKRFRTKFSQDQKEKMQKFAEKVEWKMVKVNEDLINEFCNQIGVQRGVFKVWMHNNKSSIGKSPGSGSANYWISTNHGGISANQGGISVKMNNNPMEVDEEHVNGNSHSSHNISLHQHSNASSSSS